MNDLFGESGNGFSDFFETFFGRSAGRKSNVVEQDLVTEDLVHFRAGLIYLRPYSRTQTKAGNAQHQ